ncbi:MAG: putative porin, partial [Bacteroidales bacterium]|nr:putative porin [Bacteroidales bacterium]
FLDQQYRIPFNFINNIRQKRDTSFVADDNVTTAFIGHSSELSIYNKRYKDVISPTDMNGRKYYDNFYLNPNSSYDSLRVMKLENKVFIRLQPWSEDGIVSKLNAGIGNRIMKWYDQDPTYLYKKSNSTWNSTYLYAGAEGQFRKYLHWDATGKYTFMGYEINDFEIGANAVISVYPFRRARTSPLSFKAHFETSLKEPDHYQQKFVSNHYKWDNDFGKISTTKLHGTLSIPHWNLELAAGYALLDKNIYYDSFGVHQNTTPMSVFNASLSKNFVLFNTIHLDNRILVQKSSNEDVMPLPLVALNMRYYLQFNLSQGVLQMQLGADVHYNTKWYASAWNPALGQFMNQKKEQFGNAPYIDAFANMQWKRASIFVKWENVGMGWPLDKADYFSSYGHIRTQRAIKFGIFWPFYTQARKAGSSSSTASSSSSSSSSSRSSSSSSSSRSSNSRSSMTAGPRTR